jgi:6-phosphogluconolactonase
LNLTAFASREALIEAATARLADALRAGVAANDEAFAALSGGSTPEPIYRALAAQKLDWSKITLALVDERNVPLSSPASNEAMIERAFAPAFAAGAEIKPMYFAAETVESAADSANSLYAPLRYEIALMGMGDDGHTASWFPNARGLDEALSENTKRSVVAVNAPQAQGSAERLTLTRTALKRSRALILVITGDAKRARLEQALSAQDAPVAALFKTGMPPIDVLWAA